MHRLYNFFAFKDAESLWWKFLNNPNWVLLSCQFVKKLILCMPDSNASPSSDELKTLPLNQKLFRESLRAKPTKASFAYQIIYSITIQYVLLYDLMDNIKNAFNHKCNKRTIKCALGHFYLIVWFRHSLKENISDYIFVLNFDFKNKLSVLYYFESFKLRSLSFDTAVINQIDVLRF